MKNQFSRRSAIKSLAVGTTVLSTAINSSAKEPINLKGNINHAVCYWCYSSIPFEEFIVSAAALGIKGIDLVTPEDWDKLDKHGLVCSIATGPFADISNGFNEVANHAKLQENYSKLIDQAAEKGVKQVIVFSGNRRKLSDEQGLTNCVIGLKPLVEQAEKRGVTIIMELLNSKVNHKDYMCDNTPWGAELCDAIGSESFKLLYDIYHMQIMEGDVIATIKKYHPYFSHYHTGGVPGRNEINNTQELYYPAIMKAIVDTGYKGFVAQEFRPTWEDKIAALKEGVTICDV